MRGWRWSPSIGQVDAARANLETVLDNLTAGVVVLDPQGRLARPTRARPASSRVPGRLPKASGWPTSRAWQAFAADLPRPVRRCLGARLEHGSDALSIRWSSVVRKPARPAWADDTLTLVARGAELPGAARFAGVRRHFRDRLGAARPSLGRGGAPAGARDREPAHAHPAVGRAAGAQAGWQARACRADLVDQICRKPSWTQVEAHEAAGQRVPRLTRACPLPSCKPLDLNALVAELLHLVRQRSHASAPSTRSSMPRRSRRSPAMATQLRQVLHNLIQNALDATRLRRQGPACSVKACAPSGMRASGRVRLSVLRPRRRLFRANPQAGVRALHHHQGQGHRPGPGGGQEDCRRARRPHATSATAMRGRRRGRRAQVSLSFSNSSTDTQSLTDNPV